MAFIVSLWLSPVFLLFAWPGDPGTGNAAFPGAMTVASGEVSMALPWISSRIQSTW